MALTQMQIIQSLGEAMAWFERELGWGVPATELRHLCGRIGELYAALITNGQMATEVNQKGYDVVSAAGERISVKTTAMVGSGGHISFNSNSLAFVDRVIVLRVDVEEMQIETLLDAPVAEVCVLLSNEAGGKRVLPLGRLTKKIITDRELKVVREVAFQGYTIQELENGAIKLWRGGKPISPVRPVLQELALPLNVSIVNGNGNVHNTQNLGSQIIKSVQALKSPSVRIVPGMTGEGTEDA